MVDLFAGAGGLSLGFRNAGFNIVLANELRPDIAETYRRNHPGTLMLNTDIRDLVEGFDGILRRELQGSPLSRKVRRALHDISVVIGGPPCQGFSMAGGRIRRTNEFVEDERNYLFKYYFRIIQRFEPQFFVFENVVGLLSSHGGDIVEQIKAVFSDEANFENGAYRLSINVVDAADYGVPQSRRRVLIIGSKCDFDFDDVRKAVHDTLRPRRRAVFDRRTCVRDAIADLAPISPYEPNDVPNHTATRHNGIAMERMARIRPNENWTVLGEDIRSVHSGSYGRLDWLKPSTTITTRFDTPSGGRYIHPELDRTITPREAARLQSFPDDYVFYGTKSSVCTQIGNAVPPQLAEYIAYMIRYAMEGRC